MSEPREPVYCENGQCRVETFRSTSTGGRNCPGCGQMGRTKGTEESPVLDSEQVDETDPTS
jgi:hypothetical protein